jgi:hypothetical protein
MSHCLCSYENVRYCDSVMIREARVIRSLGDKLIVYSRVKDHEITATTKQFSNTIFYLHALIFCVEPCFRYPESSRGIVLWVGRGVYGRDGCVHTFFTRLYIRSHSHLSAAW